jgi:acetyltransferase-like isoleucine patch superfamily enzyme
MKVLEPFILRTRMNTWMLRLMGASIGSDTLIDTSDIWDWDLISIGSSTVVHSKSTLVGSFVTQGDESTGQGPLIIFGPVIIGHGCEIGMAATVTAGGQLPDCYHLKPCLALGEKGSIGLGPMPEDYPHYIPEHHLNFSWRFIVILLQWLIQILSVYPGFIILIVLVEVITGESTIETFRGGLELGTLIWQSMMFLIFSYRVNMNVMSFVQWAIVLVYKAIFLRNFGPGTQLRDNSFLLARFALYRKLVELPGTSIFNTLFGNTELGRLSLRWGGATLGLDVFATGITCYTPDALTLGSYMSSGGASIVSCINQNGTIAGVEIGLGSTLGNHTILFPGSSVGVGCILGSNTTISSNTRVPSSVRVQGEIQYHVDIGADLEALEKGMDAVDGNTMFNMSCSTHEAKKTFANIAEVFFKLLFFSSHIDIIWATNIAVLLIFTSEFGYASVPIYFVSTAVGFILATIWLRIIIKIFCVDRAWKSGSASVWDLRAKMSTGLVGPITSGIIEPFTGSGLIPYLLRLMGGQIGLSSVFVGGVPTEVLMMHVGENSMFNAGCETSGHYLTKQLFTYVDINIKDNVTIGSKAKVQAGATLDSGSVLLPGSNILPGELMTKNSVWSGIPAHPIS